MMPATSEKQKRFMDAAAHNPSFAKAAGIPVSVAKEFSESSKGKTFGSGGPKSRADVQAINKPKTNHGESGLFAKGGVMAKSDMKEDMAMDLKQDKAMMQKAVNKHESRLHKGQPMTKLAGGGTFRTSANGIATKGKTKGTMIKMAGGGCM
jgi:hypothetical protein